MTRAVFFDWFHTLADFDPPRYQLYEQAFREFDVELPLEKVRRGILRADRHYFEENLKAPVAQRSAEEQLRLYLCYPNTILSECGVSTPADLPLKVMGWVGERFKGVNFSLFDDVVPAVAALKQQNYILGLLTNLDSDMNLICRNLGLESYLDFMVTSGEIGVDKPDPKIFSAALDKAGVEAGEAVHVGDQYQIDVVGARGVGISPVLVDRYDIYPEVNDCPRIFSLAELGLYL